MTTNEAKDIIAKNLAQYTGWQALEEAATAISFKMRVVQYEHNKKHGYAGRYPSPNDESFRHISTLNDKITVHTEEYYCGDTDYNEYEFPVAWFDDPEWEATYALQLEKERELRIEEAAKKEAEKELHRKNALRVRIKKGWHEEGKTGTIVGHIAKTVQINANASSTMKLNDWTPVLWDGEEDPDVFKTIGLEYIYPEDKALADNGL